METKTESRAKAKKEHDMNEIQQAPQITNNNRPLAGIVKRMERPAGPNSKHEMIEIREALQIIRDNHPAPMVRTLPLLDALGRRLAVDIPAPEPSPRYTNSAMDGFAVRWKDIAAVIGGGPITLEIAGESQAGIPFSGTCRSGQAIKISTGAMLPNGTDTVVRVEDTQTEDNRITVLQARKNGQDVRRAGEEFSAGELLLPQGTALQAPQLGLLTSVGINEAAVYCPPHVSLVVTGTELAAPGEPVAPHQIRDSNSIMLTAAVRQSGGDVVARHYTGDSHADTVAAIRKSITKSGIVIVTGGVSVGEHDHVKEAARKCGFVELFWRVRQKPGKPLFFARRGDCLLFGLPGNPVSGFMCFMYYIQPLLRSLQGRDFSRRKAKARFNNSVENKGNRTNFMRIVLRKEESGFFTAEVLAKQGSHMLGSIARADGFIIVEPGQSITEGSWQDVYLFPWRE
jgi:molybdopterin molybdotransferase